MIWIGFSNTVKLHNKNLSTMRICVNFYHRDYCGKKKTYKLKFIPDNINPKKLVFYILQTFHLI